MTNTEETTFVTFVTSFVRWNGEQILYRLSTIAQSTDFSDRDKYEYILVSAVFGPDGPETFVFPADKNGEVLDWRELPGSLYNKYDVEGALKAHLDYLAKI